MIPTVDYLVDALRQSRDDGASLVLDPIAAAVLLSRIDHLTHVLEQADAEIARLRRRT